jgi:hypothetical protein
LISSRTAPQSHTASIIDLALSWFDRSTATHAGNQTPSDLDPLGDGLSVAATLLGPRLVVNFLRRPCPVAENVSRSGWIASRNT